MTSSDRVHVIERVTRVPARVFAPGAPKIFIRYTIEASYIPSPLIVRGIRLDRRLIPLNQNTPVKSTHERNSCRIVPCNLAPHTWIDISPDDRTVIGKMSAIRETRYQSHQVSAVMEDDSVVYTIRKSRFLAVLPP